MMRRSPAPASVTLMSCCRFSKTHMAMASPVAGQVQNEVLAGELDRIQGQPGGVDGDVIGEEIRQDAEATRAFDAELARPGPRLRLDRDIAPLDAELAG